MAGGVWEYLLLQARERPDRTAYADERRAVTYRETKETAERIARGILDACPSKREPFAVFMGKCTESILSIWGVVASGNFYCPLDAEMPKARLLVILGVLKPRAVLTDEAHEAEAREMAEAVSAKVLVYEELCKTEPDENALAAVREEITECDPLYVLFTSGSTGIPKGVLVGQRVVTNYLAWLGETFSFSENDVFGNQAPFYFDVSVHDIYGAAYFGARMEIIPPHLFGFPVRLIEYMNARGVTTFLWVPSAMGIVSALKAFKAVRPRCLRHVMFAGEVLPWKVYRYWRENLPDAVFANLYGPTETFVCTAYVTDGSEKEGETLPIGRPVRNASALILDEEGREVPRGETGELCLRGSCLAMGYYGDPERTAASFVQNPLVSAYPDRIYHTGDLVRLDERGMLIYLSRKDYQIKHMGYRIELGEIENAAALLGNVENCACVYDGKKKRIVLFYEGTEADPEEMATRIAEKVPQYMVPGRIIYLDALPRNANGKTDRKALAEGGAGAAAPRSGAGPD